MCAARRSGDRRLEPGAEVADPTGAPIEITFGWASGAAGSDLHTLTEAADTALRARKTPHPRRAAA